jgi:GNAT superfamily N-acetyltransferase
MAEYQIRPTEPEDADWIEQFTIQHSHAPFVVAHGELYYPHELYGFVAESGDDCLGLITYRLDEAECEIITLDSNLENRGVGTALLETVVSEAQAIGCVRWSVTTGSRCATRSSWKCIWGRINPSNTDTYGTRNTLPISDL